MFTGLVQDVGKIVAVDKREDGTVISVSPRVLKTADFELGESIAVNGTCLTVTGHEQGRFTVTVGGETVRRTTLNELRVGSAVNLERALRVGDRLGGHMVQGHVDGVAHLTAVRHLAANLELTLSVPGGLEKYIVEKGSVTLDGVSLTVNRVEGTQFSVALIPHTTKHTTLAEHGVGERLNIEVDLMGKYIERLLSPYRESQKYV